MALPARALKDDGGSGPALDAAEERLLGVFARVLPLLAVFLRGKRSSLSASCSASMDEGSVDVEL
jgi:hypothetical protein